MALFVERVVLGAGRTKFWPVPLTKRESPLPLKCPSPVSAQNNTIPRHSRPGSPLQGRKASASQRHVAVELASMVQPRTLQLDLNQACSSARNIHPYPNFAVSPNSKKRCGWLTKTLVISLPGRIR
jgi:hypothetical protein